MKLNVKWYLEMKIYTHNCATSAQQALAVITHQEIAQQKGCYFGRHSKSTPKCATSAHRFFNVYDGQIHISYGTFKHFPKPWDQYSPVGYACKLAHKYNLVHTSKWTQCLFVCRLASIYITRKTLIVANMTDWSLYIIHWTCVQIPHLPIKCSVMPWLLASIFFSMEPQLFHDIGVDLEAVGHRPYYQYNIMMSANQGETTVCGSSNLCWTAGEAITGCHKLGLQSPWPWFQF